MISIRKSQQRPADRRRKQEVWNTFDPDAPVKGARTPERLNEDWLPPGAGFSHHHHDGEMVTYVHEGALAYEDSMGRSGIIQAGEFQRMTVQRSLRHSETNASRTLWAHAFQLWLRPAQPGLELDREQKRFSAAQRRGALCVIASPDARRGSLHLHQDALLYSALLAPGQHVAHELPAGRRVWVHLVIGRVTLGGDYVLSTGDGASLIDERVLSLTAAEESEVLMLDVGPHQSDGPLQNDAAAKTQAA
ncbi:MAG: pirin family protein [Archangium sp.]|nr:pirin family protein [Archangium sp.]